MKFHVVCPSLYGEFTTAAWPSGCLPDTKQCAVSPNLPTHTVCCSEPKAWTMERKTKAFVLPTHKLKSFAMTLGSFNISLSLSVKLPVFLFHSEM